MVNLCTAVSGIFHPAISLYMIRVPGQMLYEQICTRRDMFYFFKSNHSCLQHTFYIFLKVAQNIQRHLKELQLVWWLHVLQCPEILFF